MSNNNTVCPRTLKTNKLCLAKMYLPDSFDVKTELEYSFSLMVICFSGQSFSLAFFVRTLIFHFKFAGLKLSATCSVFAFSLTRLNIFQNPCFQPLCLCTTLQTFPRQFSDRSKSFISLFQCAFLTALQFSSSFVFTFETTNESAEQAGLDCVLTLSQPHSKSLYLVTVPLVGDFDTCQFTSSQVTYSCTSMVLYNLPCGTKSIHLSPTIPYS